MTLNSIRSLAVVALTALFVVGSATPASAQKAKKEKAKKEKVTDPRLLTVMKMAKMILTLMMKTSKTRRITNIYNTKKHKNNLYGGIKNECQSKSYY